MYLWHDLQNILEGDEYDQLGEYRHIDVRDVAEAHIRAAEIPTAKVTHPDVWAKSVLHNSILS